LGTVADVSLGFGRPGIMAGDLDRAEIGTHQAGGEAQERALAGAVVSDQAGDAGAQFEGHLVDADDGTVPLRDVLEEQDGSAWDVRLCRLRRSRTCYAASGRIGGDRGS